VDAVELGFSRDLASFATIKAAGFHNLGHNFIDLRILEDGLEHYVNLERVRMAGAELEAAVSWTPWLRVRVSYTYTWSEDVATGRQLDYVPSHMAGLGLQGTVPVGELDIIAAFDLKVASDRYYSEARAPEKRDKLDAYAVGNAQLMFAWNNLSFYLRAMNLWDARYEVTEGMEAMHFLLSGGIRVETALPGRR
jgi:outer membrane receptor protein involved in Fe transport